MPNECPVKEFCVYKGCEDDASMMNACNCKGCIQRSEDKMCEYSGEPYNTEGGCL
jgi:hypothetical protein